MTINDQIFGNDTTKCNQVITKSKSFGAEGFSVRLLFVVGMISYPRSKDSLKRKVSREILFVMDMKMVPKIIF